MAAAETAHCLYRIPDLVATLDSVELVLYCFAYPESDPKNLPPCEYPDLSTNNCPVPKKFGLTPCVACVPNTAK